MYSRAGVERVRVVLFQPVCDRHTRLNDLAELRRTVQIDLVQSVISTSGMFVGPWVVISLRRGTVTGYETADIRKARRL